MRKLVAVFLILVMAVLGAGCGKDQLTTQTVVDEKAGQLEVHYIDVGQADAILLKTPTQGNILIDGGTNSTEEELVAYLKSQKVQRLDFVIATHPHEDHIGGLDYVIDSFDIGAIYMPKASHTTKTFENLTLSIKNKNIKASAVKAGVELPLGEGGAQAVFLAPNSDQYEELNNYSAVLKLTYGSTKFIFTGDAETLSEEEILSHYTKNDLQADVLKLGHHGSNTSTSQVFFEAVSPSLAIISVGQDNDYGHPHAETLKLLEKEQTPYLRTDQEGTIVVRSDGKTISTAKQDIAAKEPLAPESEANTAANTTDTMKPDVQQIVIESVDKKAEIVTLKNNSAAAADLSDWVLVSVKGDQRYTLPEGTQVPPGGSIEIISGAKASAAQGKLLWGTANIWNDQGDPAELYNPAGELVSELK